MQPKFTHSTTSNIIKLTEEAKRKSRHRLIGSIVLLLIALVILLNVTAKVQPIPINPEIVEIKNSSTPIAKIKPSSSEALASTVAPAAATSAPTTNLVTVTTSVSKPANLASSQVTVAAHVTTPEGIKPSTSKVSASKPTPAIKANHQNNPADILNDITPAVIAQNLPDNHNSYIQFATLSTTEKANLFQQILAKHGIEASIQPITTAKGTLYRLRAGPYSQAEANTKLLQMTRAGYNGIVTNQ